MNSENRHELNLLEAIEQDGRLSQRGLATKLGIALGLTNMYLKRLVKKGYVKCVNIKANRLGYLITPTGVAEKTRLAYEYMEYSLHLYRETRRRFRVEMQERLGGRCARVAIYGTGEAAELAYLCLKEFGLEAVAVFDGDAAGQFLGMNVRHITGHASVGYDLMVVATMADPAPVVTTLIGHGVERDRLVLLRQVEDSKSE